MTEEKDGEHPVAMVYGNATVSELNAAISDKELKQGEYVYAEHPAVGKVLAQLQEIEIKSNLSFERARQALEGEKVPLRWRRSGRFRVLGYKGPRGDLLLPPLPVPPGTKLYRAPPEMVQRILNMKSSREEGALIGRLEGTEIDVILDINYMVQRHISVIAKTGSGKSYTAGVIVEEMAEKGVPVVIIDPHGEYVQMVHPNLSWKDAERLSKMGLIPRGYPEELVEFRFPREGWRAPEEAYVVKELTLAKEGLTPEEILEALGLRSPPPAASVLYRAVEAAKREKGYFYTIDDLIYHLEASPQGIAWGLITQMEHLKSLSIFSRDPTPLDEIVRPGRISVINLKESTPESSGVGLAILLKRLFEARKRGQIPPFLLVLEEAHNFCPQSGTTYTSRVLRTLSSEGRKFGLGLLVVTQRPAKVDKNVLSQCSTQIVMKLTNPLDVKAAISSVEGLDSAAADLIQLLPVGHAIVCGGGVPRPLVVEIRPRRTMHGGMSVDVMGEVRARGWKRDEKKEAEGLPSGGGEELPPKESPTEPLPSGGEGALPSVERRALPPAPEVSGEGVPGGGCGEKKPREGVPPPLVSKPQSDNGEGVKETLEGSHPSASPKQEEGDVEEEIGDRMEKVKEAGEEVSESSSERWDEEAPGE